MTETGPEFAAYWRNVRARTMRLFELVSEEDLEWTPGRSQGIASGSPAGLPVPGKFTFGDLFRHLAGIERFMYGENARGLPSRYAGHGVELAAGKDAVRAFVERHHAETCAILEALTAEDLAARCTTPGETPITVWKWLRAMVEHEAHHRGQISLMLGLRGLSQPPLYGLTEEEVAARAAR